jgi:DNA-binding ferritin-like protein
MLNDLKKAFDIANQANEQGIANFIAERIDMHAKWDWQLKATTTQGM